MNILSNCLKKLLYIKTLKPKSEIIRENVPCNNDTGIKTMNLKPGKVLMLTNMGHLLAAIL